MLTREDLEDLKTLKKQTEEFSRRVFDWVAPLKRWPMLQTLTDFEMSIDQAIAEVELLPEKTEEEES